MNQGNKPIPERHRAHRMCADCRADAEYADARSPLPGVRQPTLRTALQTALELAGAKKSPNQDGWGSEG